MRVETSLEENTPTARRLTTRPLRRFRIVFAVLLALLLTALAVPLINVNRFQRRIVASLSESLGRPVRLDRISLALLPFPGLSIDNLSVGEDPAFGAEPFIRASAVRATLRFSSLWSRRIEFSRIRFTDPSINLVKLPDGRWNLAGILLQAARMDAAPTGQTEVGTAPRFPYIEATGARLNLKLGQEKTPLSLTEAECALWLRTPGEWQMRLDGRPLRTDTSVSETGTFHLEGTLGRAAAWTQVPIDLRATWRNIPLGEASRFLLARDGGLRGSMTLAAAAQGTIGVSQVQASLHLADLRRAEFVPIQTLSLDAECQAAATESFHALTGLQCSWPPALAAGPKTLALTGTVPDLRQLSAATFDAGTPGIPAAILLDWLRIASPRIGADVTARGTLTGTASLQPAPVPGASPSWGGQFTLGDALLSIPSVGSGPIVAGDLALRTAPANTPPELVLAPVPLALGGRSPMLLDLRANRSGYTLHLAGSALPSKLLAFAMALPQIGDGLAEVVPPAENDDPVRVDLTSTRIWGGPRVWLPTHSADAGPRVPRRHSHHHR